MRGIVCVYAQPLRSGMSQGGMGRTASSSFGERANGPQGAVSAGAQHPAAWRASLRSDSEEAGICARNEAFNSFIGDGFQVPELKGGGEASEVEQADNVSNEALYVIGSRGSGEKSLVSSEIGRWQR